ncbi:YqaJ viral recombinase family protein [Pseudoroseomonas cervicalis]|uniref:YqaJ viral recombinase family protein n=1 Tax=Teichococcus cervicalis TaxID=204525 RepID=UPI002788DB24|nr:YqaJ viral recombinase family protein [Pseudoroseomonas cervicalis]MDQ1077969.1 putative phage-related endonuclease [Pseudoroseomonas cervicalis]
MALLPIPTDRGEWLALRNRFVGASEVAALFGLQADYQPGLFALWQVKAGRLPAEDMDGERLRWGLLLEEAIAQGCRDLRGWDVQPGVYATHDCGLGATLDRIIMSAEGLEGAGPLEMKNVDGAVFMRSWKEAGEPPMHIQLQLQAQLLATGAQWGAVAALIGGNKLETYIERPRPAIQAEIIKRVTEFWRRVKENVPPAPDGSDSAFRALVALTPDLGSDPADLRGDHEAEMLAEQVVKAAEAKRQAEKQEQAAKNLLLAKIGAHRWAMIDGFRSSVRVTPDNPGRMAEPGEIVGARRGSRALVVERRSA